MEWRRSCVRRDTNESLPSLGYLFCLISAPLHHRAPRKVDNAWMHFQENAHTWSPYLFQIILLTSSKHTLQKKENIHKGFTTLWIYGIVLGECRQRLAHGYRRWEDRVMPRIRKTRVKRYKLLRSGQGQEAQMRLGRAAHVCKRLRQRDWHDQGTSMGRSRLSVVCVCVCVSVHAQTHKHANARVHCT